jgi:hypothetical protein
MNKKYLIIIISIIIASSAYLLRDRYSNSNLKAKIEFTSSQLVTSQNKNNTNSLSKKRKKIPPPLTKQDKTWQEISRCYPTIESRSNYPLSDVFQQLSEEYEYMDVIDFKNYHLLLENGEIRRVQMRRDEDNKGNIIYKLKLFSVDKEGLPVPLKTITGPTPEQLDNILAQGTLTFTQKIGNRIFDENNSISFVQENGEIQSFEAFVNGHVLKCSSDTNETTHCNCEF